MPQYNSAATGHRPFNWVLMLGLLVVIMFEPSTAQTSLPEPVDPLKRPEVTPGRLSVGLTLGYVPAGGAAFGYDEEMGSYTDDYAIHTLTPDLTLQYALSERLSLGGGFSSSYRVAQTLRRYPDGGTRYLEEGSFSFRTRAALTYRLDPASPYDPSASLTLHKPWAVGFSASASLLRDPVVLSASIGFDHSFMPPYANALSLAGGAGFVANDRVSFNLNVLLTQPLSFAAAPGLSLAFRTGYLLEPGGGRELSFNLNASLKNGAASFGLGLGYHLRELDARTWLLTARAR